MRRLEQTGDNSLILPHFLVKGLKNEKKPSNKKKVEFSAYTTIDIVKETKGEAFGCGRGGRGGGDKEYKHSYTQGLERRIVSPRSASRGNQPSSSFLTKEKKSSLTVAMIGLRVCASMCVYARRRYPSS